MSKDAISSSSTSSVQETTNIVDSYNQTSTDVRNWENVGNISVNTAGSTSSGLLGTSSSLGSVAGLGVLALVVVIVGAVIFSTFRR